jgi:hypothetical protein
MMDLIVPDVPDEVVAALDAEAERLGVSRAEVARRRLTQVSPPERQEMIVADLAEFSEKFSGLADPELMAEAWR